MKLFCSNYWQNPKITAAVHYFHYNSYRYYHYHHLHYHWKMHLYHLKILLTILFIVIWSPILFNLCSFYRDIFFSIPIPSFLFFTPSKRLENIRENTDQKEFRIWTLFTQCYLHSLVYTYLHLLIPNYILFVLLYKFDKIYKIWEI